MFQGNAIGWVFVTLLYGGKVGSRLGFYDPKWLRAKMGVDIY